MTNLFRSTRAQSTENFGKSAAERLLLRPDWGKALLLSGELGSGKTTFARGFFAGLGISLNAQSPTFTFFREYPFADQLLVHADLYRFSEERPTQSRPEIVAALQEYFEQGALLLIEWADLFATELAEAFSGNSITLDITRGESEEARIFAVEFQNSGSISTTQVEALMEEFCTPIHVRQHIEKVTEVAMQLAAELFAAGVFLDSDLVKNGALCHDLVRFVDFKDFSDPSRYQEEVTPKKIAVWEKTKAYYSGRHHAAAISAILRQRGFFATAKITEAHHTTEIFRPEPFSWEEKIVYYADKRVLHDRIVSLEERFADGRKRYALEANLELEEKVFALEREIFRHLPITPEKIRENILSPGNFF